MDYLPISPLFITYRSDTKFDIYIKAKNDYILYAKHGEFTDRHRNILHENNVKELFVLPKDKITYEEYVEKNFGHILEDSTIHINERTKLLLEHSSDIIKNTFDNALVEVLSPETFEKISKLVNISMKYLISNPAAFKDLSKLINHNYKTYSHCVNTFIYTIMILNEIGFDKSKMKSVAIGSMLHDIGKSRISNDILDKPARLTDEEFTIIKTHSNKGASIAQNMVLDQIAINCILFHHEKLDGSGYPGGERDIPIYVQALTIADIYDALVSDRSYAKAYTSFEAFKILLLDASKGKLNEDLCKIFLKLLSGNQIAA